MSEEDWVLEEAKAHMAISRREALEAARKMLKEKMELERRLRLVDEALKLHCRVYGLVLAEYPRTYVLEGEEYKK